MDHEKNLSTISGPKSGTEIALWDATTGTWNQAFETDFNISKLLFSEDSRYLKRFLSLYSSSFSTSFHRDYIIYPIFIKNEWVT